MTDRAQTLDALKRMTDTQAAQVRASMLDAGQLPPPAHVQTLPPERVPVNLDILTGTLAGQAVAWGKLAPDGSAVAHFSNGLLYAGSMLGSCSRLDPDPLNVLAVFTTWAAGFARDVLTQSGISEAQTDDALENGATPELLDRLGGPLPRGALMAALSVFHAASMTFSSPITEDELHSLFTAAGHDLAGPDFIPSSGEGMRA